LLVTFFAIYFYTQDRFVTSHTATAPMRPIKLCIP
jgi:hypothetical protein